MTLPFLSTIRADNPISATGFGIRRDPEAPDIDQKLEVGLSDIGHAQRRVGDIVILKTLDQPGLQQFRNAVGPEHIGEARIVLGRREQESLRLQHRDRGRLRDRQLSLDGLARRPEILRGAQIVGDLLRRRAAAHRLFEAGDDAVEFAGIARQSVREDLADWRWCPSAAPNSRSAPNRPCASASRAAWVMLWPAPGSAISVGTSPEFASSMPPSSAITGTPVRPWNSRPTLVSARTGVVEATEIVALTRRGLSGARPRSVTSPTRMPLNSTAAPTSSPGTEPSNWT